MSWDDLILHPRTRQQLLNYLKRPTHALLLSGEVGVGLGTIAARLAKEIAGANVATLRPRLHDKQKTPNINVDDIRALGSFTRDRRSDRLAIVVDEAEQMTLAAPEAFLKALEEPVQQVCYILTTHAPAKLPATIRSRAQMIAVLPPPADVCEKLFQDVPADKLSKLKFLADRRPAEIVRLLSDEEHFHERANLMQTAKNFVQGKPETRLAIVAQTTTRPAAIALTKNVAQLLILTAGRVQNPKAAEQLTTTAATLDHLYGNGNVRAQLTALALNI